jgi:DNA polymerase
MYAAVISPAADEAEFRIVARRCLDAGVAPQLINFVDPGAPSLLPDLPPRERACALTVPRRFAVLMNDAICHRAPDRFALLYDVLWRIAQGQRELAARASDPAVARLSDYAHNVRRDIHKMHAFVRFRESEIGGRRHYAAWFEPQHYTLKRAAPFFVERFPNMDWLIATPIGTAVWQDGALRYEPAAQRPPGESDAVLDELWLTYYRTTFNPARVRLKAMTTEMPKHYWRNMPETALIPGMVAQAPARVSCMDRTAADEAPLFARKIAERRPYDSLEPPQPLAKLRQQASACQRCPLHAAATQTVFGEGPENAALMFVGEQPGDNEDIAGRPFVGPAGQLFDRALGEAGIVRETAYVTGAVKHFKYEPRGKKRIHQRPNAGEVQACKWWLEREIAAVNPALIVALGATAARALSGRPVSVLQARGPAEFSGRPGFISVHPSYLLRLPDAARKAEEYGKFVADLRRVRGLLDIAGEAPIPPPQF